MVKVESGLFNRLSGTLQKSRTTFQTRKTGIVAEKKPIPPPDPRGRRECIRWIYRYLCDKWNTLSEQEKEQYSETAMKHSITLFNAFLKEELTPRLWKCKLAKIDGQVLYLAMVEGEGNVVRDFSGLNNHGTIYGATWVTGKFGNALSFDGVDDYVDIPNTKTLLVNTTELTLEAWVKHLDIPSEWRNIISKGAFPLCIQHNYYGQCFQFAIQTNTGRTYINSATRVDQNLGKWWYVVATWKSPTMRLYINGNLDISGTRDGVFVDTTYPFNIGRASEGERYFKGEIALVGIYNRALTDEEIKSRYELTKPYFE